MPTKKPTKTTVAFLDQGEFLGGAEYYLFDFLSSLSLEEARQINPVIIGAKSESYQQKLPNFCRVIPFEIPPVKGNFLAKFVALIRLFYQARKLKKILKSQNVTHLYTNTPRAHLQALCLRWWGWCGVWTATFHDFTLRPNVLLRSIGRSADCLIAVSLPTRHWIKDQLPKDHSQKIRLIENGINPQKIPKPNPPTSIKKLLCLGRIDPRKGQKYFLEAADLLLERNPELEFTVLGSPVETDSDTLEYDREIHQFAQERNLTNVSFKGETSNIWPEINEADVVVVLTTESETFGRVVIEALSLGKLVLAFDQTGPRDILQHYQKSLPQKPLTDYGLIVPANNAMSLAETIGFWADHPQLLPMFTQPGPDFVAKNFHLDQTKKQLLTVLRG